MRIEPSRIHGAVLLLVSCLLAAALGSMGTTTAAVVPHKVKVQGFLTDRSGPSPAPANGTFSMQFAIFDAAIGGTAQATVGPLSVEVADGLYDAELDVMPDVFNGTPRYLEITVDGELLAPRIPMVSVPYALHAEKAGTAAAVESGAVGTDGLADGAVTEPKIGVVCPNPGDVLVWNGNLWSCGQVASGTVCPAGTLFSCYSGPAGTLGVGICMAGQSSCRTDGSGFDPCVGDVVPATEACDGVDNDCDGSTDEGGVCALCGNDTIDAGEVCDGNDLGGATCSDFGFSGGVLACDVNCSAYDTSGCTGGCPDADSDGYSDNQCGGLDCNDADPSINPGATEVCDGLDNDCDGATDEGNPGGGGACGTGLLGVCSAGTETCSGGALSCQPNQSGSAELCDELDNDCDGATDEGNPGGGGACGTGLLGVCSAGTETCSGGALSCQPNQSGSAELCDELDNDCDGATDEGNPGGGGACGTGLLGVCSAGTETCSGGALSCQPNQSGSAELCDELDNDCDGATDEGNPGGGGACGTGLLGVCSAGTETCSGGALSCQPNQSGSAELCDELDNDCDGATDEGNPGGGGACGTGLLGVCSAGTETCSGGALSCQPNQSGSAELCDELDNDCDGATDEGNPGGGGACGTGLLGVCSAGTETCSGGALSCQPNQSASAELCDGLDNDCDGATDEGNPGGGGACGTGLLGVCSAGTETCSGGALSCQPNQSASAELCDGLDNDCDGATDEGNPGGGGACGTGLLGVCSAGTETCSGGALSCQPNQSASAELCDGLDNDCDGSVDEDGVCG